MPRLKELPPIEYYVDTPLSKYVGPFLSYEAAEAASVAWKISDVITADQVDRSLFRIQVLDIRREGWESKLLDVNKVQTPHLKDIIERLRKGGMP